MPPHKSKTFDLGRPRRSAGVWLLATVGCSAHSAAQYPTATDIELEHRHPAGVTAVPASQLPKPQATVPTEDGVAVLLQPTDPALAVVVVRRFFRAVVEESLERLDSVLADQAVIRRGAGTGQQSARSLWQARLARLDYGTFAHRVLFRSTDIEIYRNSPPGAPLAVSSPDVLLRVPLLVTTVGSFRYFGDEIWFLLKPGPNGYKIAELAETFTLP